MLTYALQKWHLVTNFSDNNNFFFQRRICISVWNHWKLCLHIKVWRKMVYHIFKFPSYNKRKKRFLPPTPFTGRCIFRISNTVLLFLQLLHLHINFKLLLHIQLPQQSVHSLTEAEGITFTEKWTTRIFRPRRPLLLL